jgi:hypothetical protein
MGQIQRGSRLARCFPLRGAMLRVRLRPMRLAAIGR